MGIRGLSVMKHHSQRDSRSSLVTKLLPLRGFRMGHASNASTLVTLFFVCILVSLASVVGQSPFAAEQIRVKQKQVGAGDQLLALGTSSPVKPGRRQPGIRRMPVEPTYTGEKETQEEAEIEPAEVSVPPTPESSVREEPKAVKPVPTVKMVPEPIPYLEELAIDIDKETRRLAREEPLRGELIYRESVGSAEKSGARHEKLEALVRLAHLYYLTGQLGKSVHTLQQAVSVARLLGDSERETRILRDMAAAYIGWGEFQEGDTINKTALRLSVGQSDPRGAQMIRNNQGVIEKNRGQYQSARRAFNEALKTDRTASAIRLLILRNLGDLCRNWREFDCAQESYERTVTEATDLDAPAKAAEAQIRLATLFVAKNEYDRAIEAMQRAAAMVAGFGGPVDLVSKLMGDIYLDMGKGDEADPYVSMAGYESSMGRLKLLQSDPKAARSHFEKLLTAAKKQNNLNAIFAAHTGLARIAEMGAQYDKAFEHYSVGVKVCEEMRARMLPCERRNFYAAKVNGFLRSAAAKGLVRVALKTAKPVESIYPSEVTRARSFADNLSRRGKGHYFNVPESILAKEARLAEKLASLKIAVKVVARDAHPKRFAQLSAEVSEAQSGLQSFIARLRRDHEDYAAVKYPAPVTLEKSRVKSGEYLVLIDQLEDGVAVRLVKGKKIIEAFIEEWPLKDQVRSITRFRRPFEQCRLRGFDVDLARRLYERLFSRIRGRVPRGSAVTIIPDGAWALVPFEALIAEGNVKWKKTKWGQTPDGVTFLGDLYDICYYQSVTALTLVRNLKENISPGRRMLVMADPVFSIKDARAGSRKVLAARRSDRFRVVRLMDGGGTHGNHSYPDLKRLHQTGELATSLQDLYPSTCDAYTGFDCARTTFFRDVVPELNRYKYLVFATHGFASNSIPGIMEPVLWLSTVPSAAEGPLTMSDVAGLQTNAEIAALTACQTGVGKPLAGEGVMSMGRAFQCAGTRSVLMSLWGVFEPSSVTLTEEFFRQLHQGKRKLEALRNARGRIRKEGYQHPFFWAAFVLVGETS